MATRQEIADRIDDRLAGLQNTEVARRLGGVTDSAVSRWRSGSRLPDALVLAKLCERFGWSADEVLGTPSAPLPAISTDEVAETGASYGEPRGGPWTLIPKVSNAVAAGEAIYSETEVADRDWYAFREGYVRHLAGKNLERGRLVLVSIDRRRGESMLPTIRPGAMVMVDRGVGCRGWTEVEEGKIYLCRPDPSADGVTVKRVFRGGGDSAALVLWSDNTAHRPVVVDLRGKRLQQILVGRVRWIAQEEA